MEWKKKESPLMKNIMIGLLSVIWGIPFVLLVIDCIDKISYYNRVGYSGMFVMWFMFFTVYCYFTFYIAGFIGALIHGIIEKVKRMIWNRILDWFSEKSKKTD